MERFGWKGSEYRELDHMWSSHTVVQAWESFRISYGDVLRSYVGLVVDIGYK